MEKAKDRIFKDFDTDVTIQKLTELYGKPKHKNVKMIRVCKKDILEFIKEGVGQIAKGLINQTINEQISNKNLNNQKQTT